VASTITSPGKPRNLFKIRKVSVAATCPNPMPTGPYLTRDRAACQHAGPKKLGRIGKATARRPRTPAPTCTTGATGRVGSQPTRKHVACTNASHAQTRGSRTHRTN
jgi:hypothetical protein